MLRRSLLIIGAVLAILMAGSASLLSSGQLASAINLALPTGWKIETPDGIEPHLEKAILPQFTLYYQNCPIVSAESLAVQWIDERSIRLNQATIDYACLTLFPKSETNQTDPTETILQTSSPYSCFLNFIRMFDLRASSSHVSHLTSHV